MWYKGVSAVIGPWRRDATSCCYRIDIIYCINIVGFGLPASVLTRANSLRWCGGAKYNCAA